MLRWIALNLFCCTIPPLMRVVGPLLDAYLRFFRPADYRYYNLDEWAWQAYDKGEYAMAASHAMELLEEVKERPTSSHAGNAIHDANQILGLVALHDGDVAGAKDYLIRAGNTPGSAQLNSYGPRMVLARELLRAGEREIVSHYLDLVAKFWTTNHLPPQWDFPVFEVENAKKVTLLKQWKTQVRHGIVPAEPQWSRPQRPYA